MSDDRHKHWASEAEPVLRTIIAKRQVEIDRLNGVIAGIESAHAKSTRELRRDYRAQLDAKDAEIARLKSELADVRQALSILQTEVHTDAGRGNGSIVDLKNRRR